MLYYANIKAKFNGFIIFLSKYFYNRVIIALFAVEKKRIIKYL